MAPPPPRKRSHNFFNTGGASFKRTAMINMRTSKLLRFNLREVFQRFEVDPKVADPLGAMIIAKGSRTSIEEAKTYIDEKVKEGVINDEVADTIMDLLDKYGTWR